MNELDAEPGREFEVLAVRNGRAESAAALGRSKAKASAGPHSGGLAMTRRT